MAASVDGLFDGKTKDLIRNAHLLVVGAGGIGCELLKNLVLTGFEDIHLIDLDTIDVSNLNRQFLFHKQHVGKSKAVVAKESAQKLNPKCKITAYHDSITSPKYNIEFYQQFTAVLNALDNMAARKHVNRMCLAADIPLVESGSNGYLGQVAVYKKKLTECYECLPRPTPKDFPTCTIRNTPSEIIHCVVWAKHLFNQLFGEDDPHQEVSPDPTDGKASEETNTNEQKVSTREWAKSCQYDAVKLFTKLFHDDIKYLLEMKHLWETRQKPIYLNWDDLPDAVAGSSHHVTPAMRDQKIWSMKDCAAVFKESLGHLWKKLDDPASSGLLIWDKDDKYCMDFVAACANIRAYCFSIAQECRFKLKSMAGNIIPAIATTNAMIGGLIVLQLLKVLKKQYEKFHTVILHKSVSSSRKKLIAPICPAAPNPKCFVCSPEINEVHVHVNLNSLTVKSLSEKILIQRLNMVEPDAVVDDGRGTILISSDPEEMEGIVEKTLQMVNIPSGARLQCDDFFQKFKIRIVLWNRDTLNDQEFEIVGDISSIKPEQSEGDGEEENVAAAQNNDTSQNNVSEEADERDITVVDYDDFSYKRKHSEDENGVTPSKRARLDSGSGGGDAEDIIVM